MDRLNSIAHLQGLLLNLVAALAFCALSITSPSVATASFLGHLIRYDYNYPDVSTAFETATFIVGSDPEFITGTSTRTELDIDAFSIVIGPNHGVSSGQTAYYSPNGNSFNGYGFSDVDGTLPAILGASFNPSSSAENLLPEMISVTPDSILINLRGVYAKTEELIILDVTFVPEPSPAVLTGGGLVLLAHRRRRHLLQ